MAQAVSPSRKSITAGQVGKIYDVFVDGMVQSGLPSKATQWVIENEGKELVDEFVAATRRRVEAHVRATEFHILKRLPFDPRKFIGEGWKIDERVSKRTDENLDTRQITRNDYLRDGETFINGEVRLKRIKAADEGDLQLDAQDFIALWQEKGHTTLNWLYETRGITWLSFWGLVLRNPYGDRGILCLYGGPIVWDWGYGLVSGDGWDADAYASVLASA